ITACWSCRWLSRPARSPLIWPRTVSAVTRSRPSSIVPRSNARAVGILIVARVVIEAIAFACLLALAQAFTGGAAPLDLIVATAGVAGVSCVALAVLRERTTEERGRAIVTITLIASVALATGLPAPARDGVPWLGRTLLFPL